MYLTEQLTLRSLGWRAESLICDNAFQRAIDPSKLRVKSINLSYVTMHFKEQLTLQSLGWKVEMSRKWQCIFERAVDPKNVPMKGRISPKGQTITLSRHSDGPTHLMVELSDSTFQAEREWEVYFTRWWRRRSPATQIVVFLWLLWQLLPTWIIYYVYIFRNNEMFKQ